MASLPSQSGRLVPWRARDPDPRVVAALSTEFDLERTVATVLANRGLTTVDTARVFLEPDVDDLRDPFAMADMARAADRLAAAVRDGEGVLVYGDADVDGLSGTALLVHFLRFLGADPGVFVPNRAFDGYSFTDAGVAHVLSAGARVVISVDNGMSAVDPIARLQDRGVDVIVTDHHLPGPRLPPAHAVVNPRRDDCPYPFTGLAGVGVAFKLACAVASRLGEGRKRSPDMMRFLGEAMAWVALGTLADMVPLVDENRVLVKRGLRAIPLSTHPGLAALCRVAGTDAANFGAEDVAFRLAPRLNAATRMGRSDLSVSLVTTADEAQAAVLAAALDQLNRERQTQDRAMFAAIETQLDALPGDEPVILRDDRWNPGLLGLVAGRIARRTGRPAVLVSGRQGDPAKGSVRSVDGFHAQQALAACGEHLVQHGGHAMAAGFSLLGDRFDDFRAALVDHWRRDAADAGTVEPLEFDAEVPLASLDRRLAEQLERLGPFGTANIAPVLGACLVTVLSVRRMGDDKSHLSLELGQGPAALRAVSFGGGALADRFAPGQLIDVLFKPKLNRWRGRTSVELELVDARDASPAGRAGTAVAGSEAGAA